MARKPSEFDPIRGTRPDPTRSLGRIYLPPVTGNMRVGRDPNIGLLKSLSNMSGSLAQFMANKQEPVKREQELQAERMVAEQDAAELAATLRKFEETNELPEGYSLHHIKHINVQLARKVFRGLEDTAGNALSQYDTPEFQADPDEHFRTLQEAALTDIEGSTNNIDFRSEFSALSQGLSDKWRRDAIQRRGKARVAKSVDDQGDAVTDAFSNFTVSDGSPEAITELNTAIDKLGKEFSASIQTKTRITTPPGTWGGLVWNRFEAHYDALVRAEEYDEAEEFMDAFEVLNPKGNINVSSPEAGELPVDMSVEDYNAKNAFAHDYKAQIKTKRSELAAARGGATGGGDAKVSRDRGTIIDGHVSDVLATDKTSEFLEANPNATPNELRDFFKTEIATAITDIDATMVNRVATEAAGKALANLAGERRVTHSIAANQTADTLAEDKALGHISKIQNLNTKEELDTAMKAAQADMTTPAEKQALIQVQNAFDTKSTNRNKIRGAFDRKSVASGEDFLRAGDRAIREIIGEADPTLLDKVAPTELPAAAIDLLKDEVDDYRETIEKWLIDAINNTDISTPELEHALITKFNEAEEGWQAAAIERIRGIVEKQREKVAATMTERKFGLEIVGVDAPDMAWGEIWGGKQADSFISLYLADRASAAWESGHANELANFRKDFNQLFKQIAEGPHPGRRRRGWGGWITGENFVKFPDQKGFRGVVQRDGLPVASYAARDWTTFDLEQAEVDQLFTHYQVANAIEGWRHGRDIAKFEVSAQGDLRDAAGWVVDPEVLNPARFAVIPSEHLMDMKNFLATDYEGAVDVLKGKTWEQAYEEASPEERVTLKEEALVLEDAKEFMERFNKLPKQYQQSPIAVYHLQIKSFEDWDVTMGMNSKYKGDY